jgi:hypothetical protein
VRNIQVDDTLSKFIAEFGDDLCSLELLLFFGRHPNARFNHAAVVHALGPRQFDAGIALKKLREKDLVSASSSNGVYLFGLTRDEQIRDMVESMVNIDQRQWQTILEKILDAQGIS